MEQKPIFNWNARSLALNSKGQIIFKAKEQRVKMKQLAHGRIDREYFEKLTAILADKDLGLTRKLILEVFQKKNEEFRVKEGYQNKVEIVD